MTTDTHHHITLEMDKLRDAKDHPAKIQVSFNWCLSVCVCIILYHILYGGAYKTSKLRIA